MNDKDWAEIDMEIRMGADVEVVFRGETSEKSSAVRVDDDRDDFH